MKDLGIAKKRLEQEGLTLSIVKDEQVLFETASHGIFGFLRAIQELGERLNGASAADKIVGKAIALLCLYARIEEVYGSVMSREARKLLEERKVHVEWEKLVGNIQGNCKSAPCPFEALAAGITDPEVAYKKLKALQDSLKQHR
ncbi:MAG TPA: DUF1893 domain-containing protein [candidate division Zixibacteria bacterium]|nr:DUF1893 domain-containing protein [candidate division Zixibacteria bacterium]